MSEAKKLRCGFVCVVGRTNVGKSTLVNAIVGEKVAIVTPKPQTTRNVIRGIYNDKRGQIIFMDTPGLHKPRTRMNETMVRQALDSVKSVDAVLWLLDATALWQNEEERLLHALREAGRPVVMAINQIDRLKNEGLVLPLIAELSKKAGRWDIYPMSALNKADLPGILDLLFSLLPEGEQLFPEDVYTDQMERQLVAEIIREQVFARTREEVPHCAGVLVESFQEAKEEGGRVVIHCSILVERESQKPIVIGRGGQNLKAIGTTARQEMQRLLGCPVELRLFVKVHPNWRDDARILREMGMG